METSTLTWNSLPHELQREIASHLDAKSLCFFAATSKRSLKTALPYLLKYQQQLLSPPSLSITTDLGCSTFLSDAATGLYACGYNKYGQLGAGHTHDRYSFTSITSLTGKILSVTAGSCHTLVLTDQGLWAYGYNGNGQLGVGHSNNCTTFTLIKHLPKAVKAHWSLYRHI